MTLDEKTEALLSDENPTAQAVKSLIDVKDKVKGKSSSIELKTDLSEDEVKIHTTLAVLNDTIENGEKSFNESCILGSLIERKERKALSKLRQSRSEIVQVAKQPDINGEMAGNVARESMVKRLFMSRRNNQ